jgi:hypothetical protein
MTHLSRMAGRPKLTALKVRIAENDLEDEIFGAIAGGMSIGKVCERYDISSRKMFYDWKKAHPDRERKYAEARKISGEAHAEMAGDAFAALNKKDFVTGPEVSLAMGEMKYHQWLAGVYDKDQFGTKDEKNINISFGDVYMETLLARARPSIAALEPEKIVEAEYEQIIGPGDKGVEGEPDALMGEKSGAVTPSESPVHSIAPELLGEPA